MNIEIQSHLDEEPDPCRAGYALSGLHLLPSNFSSVLNDAAVEAVRFRGLERAEIEIAIVDDTQIHQLNRRHLEHDWETDVISFPYQLDAQSVQGELIVSWETAIREALGTGWPALTELALYVIHGTLHLTGMDDVTDSLRGEMRVAEQQVLKRLELEGFDKYDVGGSAKLSAGEGC